MTVYHLIYQYSEFGWCTSVTLGEPSSSFTPDNFNKWRGPYRPFGENQLSPSSVGILPLTTSHPMSLQRQRVRASFQISLELTLLKVRSLGFGSPKYYQFALSYSLSLCLSSINCRRRIVLENSQAHSSIGTRSSPHQNLVSGLSRFVRR